MRPTHRYKIMLPVYGGITTPVTPHFVLKKNMDLSKEKGEEIDGER